MRLGYGVRVKEIKGRAYVDVWRYENRDGRRVQRFEYVGPLKDPATEERVRVILDRFQAQGVQEFRRRTGRLVARGSAP
ncbi:MAG: hypothetical protein E6K10_06730 [Methanobacteriota archaeon]|nr:MAG: hypothetical protein E6K10_06730 [Euryarchaeota archaeon]